MLDSVRRHGGFPSPVWALGSQQWGDGDCRIATWAQEQGHEKLAAESSVESFFADRYGVDYVDFDLNEDAHVKLDLSEPLPADYRGGAGTVLDSGTMEHIFDIRQVIENMHEMLRPGGLFVVLAPITWWEHGFVNFNPKLFASFGSANGYEPLVEAYCFRASFPLVGEHHWITFARDGTYRRRVKLWIDRVLHRVQPSRALYFCVARKRSHEPFRVPYEVFGNW